MILIVDSGSTKTDWLLIKIDGEIVDTYKTIGFNPFFHSTKFIENEIRKNQSLMGVAEKIDQIWYYGAGCSSVEYCHQVELALRHCFPFASLAVNHDLLAAGYAAYRGKPCIACILGTGSNSCYFDGKEIQEAVPALGYILGDEGSGSYFGKKLVVAYLYGKLSSEITKDFKETFKLEKSDIFRRVYQESHANVFLAGFTRFIAKHQHDTLIANILKDGMEEFLIEHVMCFEQYKAVETNFVGSIAFYFEDALRAAAEECGVKIGHIVKSPIHQLMKYHLQYIFNNV